MTWWERWAFNTLHWVVAITGFAYLCMKYAMATDDPFAVINHPWEPATLALHLVAAPVFIAFFGMLFRSHSLRKLRSPSPENRRTGWMSLVGFSVMALSGYAIQVVTAPALITFCVWLHVVSGGLFALSYSVHLVIGWRVTRQSANPPPGNPESATLAQGTTGT